MADNTTPHTTDAVVLRVDGAGTESPIGNAVRNGAASPTLDDLFGSELSADKMEYLQKLLASTLSALATFNLRKNNAARRRALKRKYVLYARRTNTLLGELTRVCRDLQAEARECKVAVVGMFMAATQVSSVFSVLGDAWKTFDRTSSADLDGATKKLGDDLEGLLRFVNFDPEQDLVDKAPQDGDQR